MKPGIDYVGVGVGALIVRDHKALMLLRTDRCRNNRGMWTIPGGMAEVSETLEDAVRREALEEAGVRITVNPLFIIIRPFLRWPALGQCAVFLRD